MASLTYSNGSLVYQSRYEPGLVAALKMSIPETDRRWDGTHKAWIVTPQHADLLVRITAQHLGETISAPRVNGAAPAAEQRLLDVRYIGATKDRNGDVRTANAWVNGGWSVVFPEPVLRAWFEQPAQPDEAQTLYGVLAVTKAATPDEIKSAYRRMARSYHPDMNHEPGAAGMFIRIKAAYDILSAPNQRAKYDAGLALEASLRTQRNSQMVAPADGYRAPLRCGYILATGREQLARFVVSEISMWEDIVRADGAVLVTSWPVGADRFVESWS